MPTLPDLPAAAQQRLDALLASGERRLIGLIGPPGAGKSTLAAALHAACETRQPGVSQIVPMDGYHLANVELARLGRAGRKGAPDTFDAAGYAALLRRLRQQGRDEVIYAPEFRREIEEPIAGAIPVFAQTRLIIAEGNYLLLPEGAWAGVAGLLDETWYVDIDPALRTDRLVRRHEQFGRSPQAARDWVTGTDEPNAIRIEATRPLADWVFRW
ncbi:MAG: nucleoside/nucleotide kinase family protein [Leptothrix sp. (in: b-proteobacteria)]